MTTTARKLVLLLNQATYAAKVYHIFGSDLVGYWPLNEASGTAANNLALATAPGVYNSVTLAQVAGPGPSMGLAPQFDGINDNVTWAAGPLTALNAAWNPDEFTVVGWFKMDTAAHWNDAVQKTMFYIGVDGNNRYGIIKDIANRMQINVRRSASNTFVLRTGTNELTWIHIALTISVSLNKFRVFWQGSQLGADQAVAGAWAGGALTSSNTQIGSVANGSFWTGNIAHVALFKRALNATEVASLAVAV